MTGDASKILTEAFNYPIPQRWSSAHLYHAIMNQEAHVKDISLLTTLSGYIHWLLTGEKVIGLGEASGMFPIDVKTLNFDQGYGQQFDGMARDCVKTIHKYA
jgi:sugar (pentulose or hexulose) kinase